MIKFVKTIIVVIMLSLMGVTTVWAIPYIETYDTAPGGTGYAALEESPNGLVYDVYHGRAFSRLAGYPVIVSGPGDEKFYWGNNGILPGPLYGEPGNSYCDDDPTAGYLFNGYGTGYYDNTTGIDNDFVLGIDFTNGPTRVFSLDFGYASGSNAPTHHVEVIGLNSDAVVWDLGIDVNYGGLATLSLPDSLVDRIEIVRDDNITPLFHDLPIGWYIMDNLTYDIQGLPDGEYKWEYYTRDEYLAPLGAPVPEPGTIFLLSFGLIGLVGLKKRV